MKHRETSLILSLILFLSFPFKGMAQNTECFVPQPDPNFHIYISIGQSNMEGQGAIADADLTDINPRFLTLAATDFPQRCRARGEWYPAMPPICREDLVYDNPSYRGLGPTDYFGRTMVENTPDNVRIGVICVAVGAAKIEGFYRDINVAQDYYNHQCKDYVREKFAMYDYYGYGHILSLARQAQQVGVIRGILLHQGESNYGETDWPLKVKSVYDNLLADLGLDADQVPLLVGEVTENGPSGSMNSIIRTVPDYIPTAHVISSAGAAKKSWDPIHFDSEGYREMGRRYAKKMLELEGYDVLNLQLLLAEAQNCLTYSSAPANKRIALQNAIQQAQAGTSTAQNLQTAIRDYILSAKPVVGHPFDLTWTANTQPASFVGSTGTYSYTRFGISPEFYVTNAQKQGVVMHQNISALPDGTYNVVVHASSSFTSGRGFSSPITTEGGDNRTYVYANNVAKMVPVLDVGNNLIYEPHTYVLGGVRVEGGNLDIGIRHDQPGANWDVLQILHIARTASAADSLVTLRSQLHQAQSRASLFTASATLPQAFRQHLEAQLADPAADFQSAITRLQDDLETASHISMAARAYQLSLQKAEAMACVPFTGSSDFDAQLSTLNAQFSSATSAATIDDIHACLRQAMYDHISQTSPADNHTFDLTYLLHNPDLNLFQTGAKADGWTTEQTDGTIQVRSDGSVISADGRQTFCEYSASAITSVSAYSACQTITLPAGHYHATALAFATTDQPTVRPIVTLRAGITDGSLVHSSILSPVAVDFELTEEQTFQLGLYAHAGNRATRMGIGYMQLFKTPDPTATDIVEIHSANSDGGVSVPFGLAPVYNLQGQRIADSLDSLRGYRGIVVVKGKKMILK